MPDDPAASETTRCQHSRLQFDSGGYYICCIDCPQSWVARRQGCDSDTDLDRGPALTCTTPLAGQGQLTFGRWSAT
jgi:hypothetical protein